METLRSVAGALPATLARVPEALRSTLQSSPGPAAGSGKSLRGSWSGEGGRVRPLRQLPASNLKPYSSRGAIRERVKLYEVPLRALRRDELRGIRVQGGASWPTGRERTQWQLGVGFL